MTTTFEPNDGLKLTSARGGRRSVFLGEIHVDFDVTGGSPGDYDTPPDYPEIEFNSITVKDKRGRSWSLPDGFDTDPIVDYCWKYAYKNRDDSPPDDYFDD